MGISFQKVSYTYGNVKKNPYYALKEINLTINEEDEFVALVGHTGSGKSTLALHMNALNIPSSGDLFIYGVKITKKRKRKDNYNQLRKNVGVVFQFPEYQLFEETVLKDVMFAPKNFGFKEDKASEMAKQALELLHIKEEYYAKSPFMLSGGEKKRVSIAGILAMEPDILVLDEPTSGLDPQTRDEILSIFTDLNVKQHKSIVIITHDMNIVSQYAKRVLVMNQGSLVFDGTPNTLFRKDAGELEKWGLDLPDQMKILKQVKEKLNLDIDIYQPSLEEATNELKKVKL